MGWQCHSDIICHSDSDFINTYDSSVIKGSPFMKIWLPISDAFDRRPLHQYPHIWSEHLLHLHLLHALHVEYKHQPLCDQIVNLESAERDFKEFSNRCHHMQYTKLCSPIYSINLHTSTAVPRIWWTLVMGAFQTFCVFFILVSRDKMLKYRSFSVIFVAFCILNSVNKISIRNYLLISYRILLLPFIFWTTFLPSVMQPEFCVRLSKGVAALPALDRRRIFLVFLIIPPWVDNDHGKGASSYFKISLMSSYRFCAMRNIFSKIFHSVFKIMSIL